MTVSFNPDPGSGGSLSFYCEQLGMMMVVMMMTMTMVMTMMVMMMMMTPPVEVSYLFIASNLGQTGRGGFYFCIGSLFYITLRQRSFSDTSCLIQLIINKLLQTWGRPHPSWEFCFGIKKSKTNLSLREKKLFTKVCTGLLNRLQSHGPPPSVEMGKRAPERKYKKNYFCSVPVLKRTTWWKVIECDEIGITPEESQYHEREIVFEKICCHLKNGDSR